MSDFDETNDPRGRGEPDDTDLLTGDPGVRDFLDRLREAGRGPAPTMSDQLTAALWAASSPRRPRGLGQRGVVGAAVVGCMALGVGAAAADSLPRPVQRVVEDVIGRWMPGDRAQTGDATPPPPSTHSLTPTPAVDEPDNESPEPQENPSTTAHDTTALPPPTRTSADDDTSSGHDEDDKSDDRPRSTGTSTSDDGDDSDDGQPEDHGGDGDDSPDDEDHGGSSSGTDGGDSQDSSGHGGDD